MLWIGESTTTLDKTYTLKAIVSEVNKVTRKDLREVARHIFKEEKINLALIGPEKLNSMKLNERLRIQ